MDLKAVAGKLGGFVGHYGGELSAIAGTLGTIVDHLPIDQQDKERIGGVIGGLHDAAERAAAGANAIMQTPVQEVTVSKDDVEAAVAAYLSTHLDAAVKAYVDGHQHAGE